MAICVPSANNAIKRTMNRILPNRNNNQATFRPRRGRSRGGGGHDDGSELYARATETLGSGNLKHAVRLPDGEDMDEWIAVNIVDFFNQLNMLYGTITEYCTPEKCPIMCAGAKYEYYWSDGSSKKPIKCSAPQYIDYLMAWVQNQIEDESLFPTKIGVAFPSDFTQVSRTIMKRLFRIYAHVYHEHFEDIQSLKEEAHLNTSFKHFILFVTEFRMIDDTELAPLHDLIGQLIHRDDMVTHRTDVGNDGGGNM